MIANAFSMSSKHLIMNSKVNFLVAVLVVVLAIPALAGALEDGNAAFAKGDYVAASRAFDTALASGPVSAGLYYNLAMAQLKEARRPEAAVSLRRAIMLDPQMIDARMALSELEKSQGIAIRPDWRDTVAERAPLNTLFIGGALLAWLGAFLLLRGFFPGGRRGLRLAGGMAVFVLGAGIFAVGFLSDPRIQSARDAVVIADGGTALRASPADQSDAVTKLPECAPVRVLQRSGEWTYCQAPSGEKGWTATAALIPVRPEGKVDG